MEVAVFQEGIASTRACSQWSCTCQAGFNSCPVSSVASLAGCLAPWVSQVWELQRHSGPELPREPDPGQPGRCQQVCPLQRASLAPARLAQSVPNWELLHDWAEKSNFILWGISETLIFIHIWTKKKNFGKKDSFWNHESNSPLSSNKQIAPKEGRETLQEKEWTKKKKKWGKSNKWGFLQSPVTMRQLHPGIHDPSWRIAPETASIWQDQSWTQCTGFPGGASIGCPFLWKESMASLHPWGSPSQWTSTRLPLLLDVAKAWGSFSPPWENEVGRCEGSLPKSGRRAIPPFTTPSSSTTLDLLLASGNLLPLWTGWFLQSLPVGKWLGFRHCQLIRTFNTLACTYLSASTELCKLQLL